MGTAPKVQKADVGSPDAPRVTGAKLSKSLFDRRGSPILKKVGEKLQTSYMQKLHDLMPCQQT
jgi:hypothetical protein